MYNASSFQNLFIPLTNRKAIFIITLLGFIIFGNMLFNGFVWDDKSYILFNDKVHTFTLPNTFGKNLFNTGGNYRPISVVYFSSLYRVFGDFAFPYHFLQLILHIINTILVFILFKRFISKGLALFTAIIFLIHPIQIESVSYIASTGNNLFFLFGILALLLSLSDRITHKKQGLICLLLFLSLLSKETGILFLVIIPAYRILFKKSWGTGLYLYESVALAFYLALRLFIGKVYLTKLETIPIVRLSLIERIINIPAIIFYYIKIFLFPVQLSVQQYWLVESLNVQTFYVPLILDFLLFLLMGLIGARLFKTDRKRFLVFIFFVIWLGLGLLMHLHIFPLDFTVSDRWFYFPIVGALGIIGVGLYSLRFFRHYKRILVVIGIIYMVLFAVRTMTRNLDWHDSITLFTHDAKIQDNFDIENNLGVEYGLLQNYKQSLVHYKKSAELFPQEGSIFNMGFAYEQMGDSKNAEKYYYKSLTEKNYSSPYRHELDTYVRLAWVLILSKQFGKAEDILKLGLSDFPTSPRLLMQLTVVKYATHYNDQALALVKKTKTISPNDDEINYLYSQISNNKPIDLKKDNRVILQIVP